MQKSSKQKQQESCEEQSKNGEAHCELGEVKSQFHPRYETLSPQTAVDEQTAVQDFSRTNVEYSPRGPFKAFEFEVERIVPELEYYRFNVKLGHFKLLLSSVKLDCESPFMRPQQRSGCFGKIYFFDFDGEQICIKSIPYKSEREFEVKLAKAVKELSILKVCSVLGCSVSVRNYFGFDIIIYSDCVQFAMERGEKATVSSVVEREHLKEQLRLMHHFKIIHFDIKPENIVFSKHFNKHVFIDFGFSEIVKERCGLKTLTSFRGTPNYITEQIMALMWVKQGYADLYYNDAYALNQCLAQKPKKIYECESEAEEQTEKPLKTEFHQNNLFAYLFLAFQFHYLNEDQLRLKYFAAYCLSNVQNSIKPILLFIGSCLKYVFLQTFFMETLKPYESLAQYSQIKEKIKTNKSTIFFKLNYSHQPFKTIKNQIDQKFYFESRLSAILAVEQLDDQFTPFVASAFQCVRFDRRNLQLKDKLQIAKKMKTLLPAHLYASLGEDGQKEIQDLIALTKAVYRHCLSYEPSRQIRELIFKVFQHFVLFDIEYSQLFDKLREFIGRNGSHFEAYEVIIELSRLLNLIKFIQTSHVTNITVCYEQIKSLLHQRMHKFLFETNSHTNKQAKSVRTILLFYSQASGITHSQIQKLRFQLKSIKSIAIKNHLLFLFVKKLLKLADKSNKGKLGLIAVDQAKAVGEYDILNYVWTNYSIINKTNNFSWLETLKKQVSSVINCSYVFDRLRINQYIGYLPFGDALSFIQRYPLMCKIYHKIDNRFFAVISQIYNSKPQDPLRGLLPQLYRVYYDNRKFKKQATQNSERYQLRFQRVYIEYYFYLLSPQTRTLFEEQLMLSMESFSKLTLFSDPFLNYNYYLYQFKKHKIQNNPKLCLQSLYKVIQYLPSNECINLKLQIYREIINISPALSLSQTKKSVKALYDYCQASHLFYSYLLIPCSEVYIYQTLRVLAQESQALARNFLFSLTNIFAEHPFQDYFDSLVLCIHIFIMIDPRNKDIITYDKFCEEYQCNFRVNPYILIFIVFSLHNGKIQQKMKMLKVFAKNCQFLPNFAQRKLLTQYYMAFLLFVQQQSKRKRRFVYRLGKKFFSEKFSKKNSRLLQPNKKTKKKRQAFYFIFLEKAKAFNELMRRQNHENKIQYRVYRTLIEGDK